MPDHTAGRSNDTNVQMNCTNPKDKLTRGVNPGGDGGDMSPPVFEVGGTNIKSSPPLFNMFTCLINLFLDIQIKL